LSKKLYYDWHQRYSFLDHFLHPNTTFENFYKSQYGEQGNFTIEEYQVDKIDKKNFVVSLSRIGNVWVGSDNCRLKITKKYSIEDNKNSINCEYYIENLSEKEISLWFLTELNMLVFGKQQNTLLEFEAESYKIIDEDKKFTIEINSEQKKLFWVFPIETISMSEAGFERTYQGLCIAISSKFVLQKEQMYTTKIVLEIK